MNRPKLHHLLGLGAVLLLSMIVCVRFYADVLRQPGAYLFGAEGDGLKNYYSVAFQAVHGQGWTFRGMLHPFTDYILFADGQPLLTSVLQQFHFAVNQGHQVIAAMNLLMIASLVVCALLMYLILRRCLVAPWFAVPFAVLIAFLSPQLARFTGHYALSYGFFVPMVWYLLIRLVDGRSMLWALALAASVLAFAFVQPYYLMLSTVFIGAVLVWDGVALLAINRKPIAVLPKMVAVVLPLLLFSIYMAWYDSTVDRPAAPYGTFHFLASPQSVFVPVMEPFKSLFTSYFFRLFEPAQWEGYAYVGLVPALCGLCAFSLLMARKQWGKLLNPTLPTALNQVWLPAFIVLLFGMGVFHYLGLHWLGERVSAIRQFRSLGRMAWVFYYVFAAWAVVYLYRLFRYLGSIHGGRLQPLAYFLLMLSLGWWTLDAIVNIKAVKEKMIINQQGKAFFGPDFHALMQSKSLDPAQFQAIVPLPFELIGSEKIELNSFSKATPLAMQASFSTGLPMMNGVMSRTSLSVTEQLAQLVAHPLVPRPVLDRLDPHLDLLLIAVDGPLTDGERFLLEQATPLFAHNGANYLRLKIATLKQALNKAHLSALGDTLAMESPFLAADEQSMEADALLLDTLLPDGAYVFSFWIQIDRQTTSLPTLEWTEGRDQLYSKRCGSGTDLLDGWLMVSQPFTASTGRKSQFWLRGQGGMVRQPLIRKAGQSVWSTAHGQRYYNGIGLK